VLLFLLDNADSIEARSESECWRAAWQKFSRGVFDRCRHDGPRLEFENVVKFYGFAPVELESDGYTLKNVNFDLEFAR